MKKRILAVLALLLLFGGTTLAFGYWDVLSQDADNNSVVIGEGVTLTVGAAVTNDGAKKLVPSGVIMGPNDTTSYTITYEVNLSKETAADLALAVTVDNLEINSVATVNGDLINVAVTSDGTINNTTETITIVVTFVREPADLAEYNLTKNLNITFDLTFLAS